ncbi:MAG: hypothetical protein JWQ27_724 [Ferruginibacter sp.]|nr:hypothetical protein [Ferruginibacter sp.]
MRWLNFIFSHSIFISFCAIALCFQTYALLHMDGNPFVYGFIFFSTLSSYNFYWFVSKYSFNKKPFPVFIKENKVYLFFFFIAGLAMLYCLLKMDVGYYAYVGLGIVFTLLYSLPLWPFAFAQRARKAGFLKTTLLSFTWAYVTVIIPAFPVLQQEFLPVLVLFIARFFFMLMLCTIFDMRDSKIDKLHSLRSLATDVSRSALQWIMTVVFFLYMGAGYFVRHYFHDNAQVVAFLLTGIIVWIVYRRSLKTQGYFFYYFLVDGLMLLSAVATFAAQLVSS